MPTVTFAVFGTGVRQDVDVAGSGHVMRTDADEPLAGTELTSTWSLGATTGGAR